MMERKDFKQRLIDKSYAYSLAVIKFSSKVSQRDYVVQVIIRQLIRCSTSIGANIIEAQAASSRKDFVNFLNHALKSANECTYWLRLLKDSEKVCEDEIVPLLTEAGELSRVLGACVRTLRKK